MYLEVGSIASLSRENSFAYALDVVVCPCPSEMSMNVFNGLLN